MCVSTVERMKLLKAGKQDERTIPNTDSPNAKCHMLRGNC